MRRVVRENALCGLLAAAGCLAVAWLGLTGFAWTDYDMEARGSVELLLGGHIHAFLQAAPAYGGSLIERAPFAFLPSLWGGGPLAVYRMLALPSLLAAIALAVWLVALMRTRGYSTLARAVTLGVCVANPVTLAALEMGHPEELLGACLCVAAVMLAAGAGAQEGRPLLAGACLGLAIANKDWAILATGPVLLALPAQRRLPCLLAAGISAGAVLAPLLLSSSSRFVSDSHAIAGSRSAIFEPWQIWWFLGHHGALVRGLSGPKPGYRLGPAWIESHAHALIVLVGFLLAAALWLQTRAHRHVRASPRTALLALALLLLLRCVLDTWDFGYYPLPFLLALLAWESTGDGRRPPVLALASTLLVWISFEWLPAHVSADAQAAFFLAWTLPLAGWMGLRLFWPTWQPGGLRLAGGHPFDNGRPLRAQEMTVSALERPVSTS
jgi:hypothetical protein